MANTMTFSKPEKSVCVFCGSSFGKDPIYSEEAAKLGKLLAQRSWGLVYGGGSTGVMGAVAKGCASNGGYVHGILPKALVARERIEHVDKGSSEAHNELLKKSVDNHDGTTPIPDSQEYGKTTLVDDMHTRKRLMGEESDAFISLPGGYGTLEELMEVVTWFQLNIHKKPIVILNTNGFYDNFLKFIRDAIDAEFVSTKNGGIINVASTPEEALEIIAQFKIAQGQQYDLNWAST